VDFGNKKIINNNLNKKTRGEMMKNFLKISVLLVVASVLILSIGCSNRDNPVEPQEEKVVHEIKWAVINSEPTDAKFYFGTDSLMTPDSIQVDKEEKIVGVLKKDGYKNYSVTDISGPGFYFYILEADSATPVDTVIVVVDSSRIDTVIVADTTVTVPDSGAISISSHPAVAWYFVANAKADTVARGTTPENGADIIPVPVGEYSVRVGKQGYKTHAPEKVQIQYSGHIVEVNPWLIADPVEPNPPTPTTPTKIVSWNIYPPEAKVEFDGNLYSVNENYVEVDSGSVHRLQVSAGSNYSEFDSTFAVNENIHLNVMLVKKQDPDPIVGPQGCFTLRSDGKHLYLGGEAIGPSSESKYGIIIWNGGTSFMDTTYIHNLQFENNEYMVPFNDLAADDYTRFTLVWGNFQDDHWYYKGQTGCDPDLNDVGVWYHQDDYNWFGFWWDKTEPPVVPNTYHLTVNNGYGYGDGDYEEGTVVNIYAHAPQAGYHFAEWTGDVQYIADPSNNETSVTMPAGDVVVTAIYAQDEPPDPPTKGTFKLTVVTPNTTVRLNDQLWDDNGEWKLNPDEYRFIVSKTGFYTHDETFNLSAGQTVERTVILTETPPPPPPTNPLKVEASENIVKLSGDGYENWLGLELYDPDQNETTGWIVNHWVKGTDKGSYTEFIIPDHRLSHGVFWKDATPGLQGSGGAGISPRFTNWDQLQKGSGISQINTDPGFFVRNP